MMRSGFYLFALGLVAACVGRQAAPESASGTPPSVPDALFGIVLRKPLNPAAVVGQRCLSARRFAMEDGSYHIVADDALLSVPHEHQDTTAVRAALDSFTVCRVQTRELNASALVTVSDSVVGHALISWPDGNWPSYDRMRAMLTQKYGEPFQSAHGVPFWAHDSIEIHLTTRGPYDDGTTLTLSDERVCERYERLVHNNSRDQRTDPCWEEPKRLSLEEIFTERPASLADSDLTVAGVPYGADSALVRRTHGAPSATDSIWAYPGLRIWFIGGRVHQIALNTPRLATARGLRVGDRVARAKALYGTPCILEIWAYCRTVTMEPDPRALILEVKDRIITEIRVGAIFAPE